MARSRTQCSARAGVAAPQTPGSWPSELNGCLHPRNDAEVAGRAGLTLLRPASQVRTLRLQRLGTAAKIARAVVDNPPGRPGASTRALAGAPRAPRAPRARATQC